MDAIDEEEFIECRECGELKPKKEFGKNRKRCNSCRVKYQREYQLKNKDAVLAKKRAYEKEKWKDPNHRQKKYEYRNTRYKTDSAYREKQREYRRLVRQKRRESLDFREKERERSFQRSIKPESRQAIRSYRRKRSRENWELCISLAGGTCQKCHETDDMCWIDYDFHHVVPATKKESGAQAVWDLDLEELDKCTLLCCKCHRRLTAKLWDGEWKKRDGLGWELIKWWPVMFRDL